jgi:hypothetical protein
VKVALVVALVCALTTPALADDNDLVVGRLGTVINDGMGQPIDVIGDPVLFRSLASELGVVMAPRLVEPADTLGFSGFQFAADLAFTSINNRQPYWRVLESSPDPAATAPVDHGGGTMTSFGAFVRKGIWLPLPSFEVGTGVVHLLGSNHWAGQFYAKFALHEGFHDLPLPSVAVRGAVSRVFGTDQIDLTVPSIDVSVSKHIGINGTFNLAPFAGWNWLLIVPRSEVIDKTPNIDPRDDPDDSNLNFTFPDQDTILRQRFFGGVKLNYYVFALTLEANFALAGSSTDDRGGTDMDCADATNPTANCDATDEAGAQSTFTVSLGVDF